MTTLCGSKRLGRWVASDKIDVLERRKIGRATNGALVLQVEETGKKFAVFPRLHKHTYRAGRPTMNAARHEGVECWFLDPEALRSIRRKHAPTTLIIFETDTEDYWLSRFDDWFGEKRLVRSLSKDGGKSFIMLPVSEMKHCRSREQLSFARR